LSWKVLVTLRHVGHIASCWSHCVMLVTLCQVGHIAAFWSQCDSNETNQEGFA